MRINGTDAQQSDYSMAPWKFGSPRADFPHLNLNQKRSIDHEFMQNDCSVSAELHPAPNRGVGRMSAAQFGRRSRPAIDADIRECAAIWLRRAEDLFGDPATFEHFVHAAKCAWRFEAELTEREKQKQRCRSVAAVKQVPAALAAVA
jgi:hypothetical protein